MDSGEDRSGASGAKSIDSLIQNGYTTDAGSYISRGWALMKPNLGGFVGFTAIALFALPLLAAVLPERLQPLLNGASLVISGPLYAGFYIVAFKIARQRPTTFSDFFRGFNNLLPLFLASLLVSIFCGIGFLLLIIPGVYLAVAYIFVLPLIIEGRLDFWEAMEASRKLVTKQWFPLFGFVLLLVLINLGGAILCGLGLLFTVPLTYCAIAAAYEGIVGLATTDSV